MVAWSLSRKIRAEACATAQSFQRPSTDPLAFAAAVSAVVASADVVVSAGQEDWSVLHRTPPPAWENVQADPLSTDASSHFP